ncbi:DUF2845 domain-containing protein [Fangia hongkongensis]|uniref:DUF2845 domain-containing protein n=1 Tax=Fangia hongkongensis TaxID=270495 RepID=UPI00035CE5D9|nr:DUF2845 domain-containing protein [Fangia hongkongensis]
MKKIIPIALASITLISTGFAATSATISCNDTNITLGMSAEQVQKACGKPFSTHTRTTKTYLKYKTLTGTVETETKMKFVNNKLVSLSYEQEDEAKNA